MNGIDGLKNYLIKTLQNSIRGDQAQLAEVDTTIEDLRAAIKVEEDQFELKMLNHSLESFSRQRATRAQIMQESIKFLSEQFGVISKKA